jgi:hypothetical protein
MFARNVFLSTTTIPKLLPARRKMGLSDAIRCGSGETARRGADNAIAASTTLRVKGHWPLEGVHVDWQLEEPEVAVVSPVSVFYSADSVLGHAGAGRSLAQRM